MESASLSLFNGFCEDPRRFISDMVEGFLSSGFEETWDWWQDAKGLKQKECSKRLGQKYIESTLNN